MNVYLRSNSLRSTEGKIFSSNITKKTDKAGDGLDSLADPNCFIFPANYNFANFSQFLGDSQAAYRRITLSLYV